MVNYKINKDKFASKRKVIILGTVLLVVIIATVLTIVLWPEKAVENKEPVDNPHMILRNVNGKLAKYITSLGEEYYIKYTGKFGKRSLNNTLTDATIEYTTDGDQSAIYSEEVNIRVVMTSEYSYNILNKQKIILKAKSLVKFSTEPYNLVSDFGQIYIEDVETVIDGVKYIYQEYAYDNAKIRYYFNGEELSYIRIIVGNDNRKINIRTEKKAKEELFKMPKDYISYDI